MDVRAILIVAPPAGNATVENIAGVPLAFLDVLGRPVVLRVMDRLRKFGITRLSVINGWESAARPFSAPPVSSQVPWVHASGGQVWRAAENAFSGQAQSGADVVLALRLGAYTDIDFDELIQFHLDRNSRVTAVYTPAGAPLDIAAIASSRRNDAAFLFRRQLREFRVPAEKYVFQGYVNRLAEPAALRRLALDGFVFRVQIPPAAAEVRPGVWIAPGRPYSAWCPHRRAGIHRPPRQGTCRGRHHPRQCARASRGGGLRHRGRELQRAPPHLYRGCPRRGPRGGRLPPHRQPAPRRRSRDWRRTTGRHAFSPRFLAHPSPGRFPGRLLTHTDSSWSPREVPSRSARGFARCRAGHIACAQSAAILPSHENHRGRAVPREFGSSETIWRSVGP